MPLSRRDEQYTVEEWECMQQAHMIASTMLGRDIKTHEYSDRSARMVITLFSQGMRDPQEIAIRVVNRELELSLLKEDEI
ncbi:hypothetical protein [Phyllobacterium sp. SB3]|uniref:hypothetical protein n=1 Tax=Phyllobacterium sp. SB3 TaxID=3156073 RepID=UPI0032AF3B59